ncbi:MAG: hypothetical protein AAF184_25640, partial [Pseudomonadota bacterium]
MRRDLALSIGPRVGGFLLGLMIVAASFSLRIAHAQAPDPATEGLSADELAEPAPQAEPPTADEDKADGQATAKVGDQTPLDISWDDLLPEGELDRLEELYR